MLDHPRSATDGLIFFLKFGLDPIYSLGDFVILYLAVLRIIHCEP